MASSQSVSRAVSAAVLLGMAVLFLASVGAALMQTDTGHTTRLAEHVARAKARGMKRVEMPAPLPTYAEVNSVSEALRSYTLVTAEVVGSQSVASSDEYQIFTFYKFRVLDNLSNKLMPAVEAMPAAESLLPISSGEFVLRMQGGEVERDGIRVRSRGDTPPFTSAKQYMLFLAFHPDAGGLASLEIGPTGVYTVEKGKMVPLEGLSRLARDLHASYANSLSRLQDSIH